MITKAFLITKKIYIFFTQKC